MPEVLDHDPGASYGIPAPEMPFAVDLDDLQAYIRLLETVREADLAWGRDEISESTGFSPVGDDLNLLDKWQRRFDGLRNAMDAGYERIGSVVWDVESTLDNIATRYDSTDEENRRSIDEIYIDAGDSTPPPRTGVRRTFDPFDYRQGYNKANRDSALNYSRPDECFVNGDPTGLWFDAAKAKAFLLNLGVDTTAISHTFAGDWTVLSIHERVLRIHQDVTGNAAENMSYGMAGLEGTWYGRASHAAAECVNQLASAVKSDGYPTFDVLLDGYAGRMEEIYGCAESCASSLGWALDLTRLALELYPALDVFPNTTQIPAPNHTNTARIPGDITGQKEHSAGSPLALLGRASELLNTVNLSMLSGAMALLQQVVGHLIDAMGAASVAFIHLTEVETLMAVAIIEVEAMNPARLDWWADPDQGGRT
ncbi:hypothetical protein FB566_3836 [Stackebrandtia endophytica]|uniref:Uncharacterized protein n=1 Tax=Stackebrandtia endophytica TaxID=1496996 RepID=A0A543B095_9ACTN|nr:hypothetical protein [Stackebrandtia endophytica]TQL78253.1 hypothetical protein FB566_3836 [Stackebrandtia endophytica]